MTLRFMTSIATDRGSFLEGQVIDVGTPSAEHLKWLKDGIVTAAGPAHEVAVAVPLTRGRRSRASGRKAPSFVSAVGRA
jgi:rare lipoprotein A (peptidoglycan hydrolase)